MPQKMIRVSEAAYWELKSRGVLARQSVAGVVDDLLRETLVRMEPPAARDRHDAWRVPAGGVSPAATELASEIVAKSRNGPFSKAAQMGRKS